MVKKILHKTTLQLIQDLKSFEDKLIEQIATMLEIHTQRMLEYYESQNYDYDKIIHNYNGTQMYHYIHYYNHFVNYKYDRTINKKYPYIVDYEINKVMIKREAEEIARSNIEKFAYKMVEVKLSFVPEHIQFETNLTTDKGGVVGVIHVGKYFDIHTTAEISVSIYGKVFVRFPSRFYLNGKMIPEKKIQDYVHF